MHYHIPDHKKINRTLLSLTSRQTDRQTEHRQTPTVTPERNRRHSFTRLTGTRLSGPLFKPLSRSLFSRSVFLFLCKPKVLIQRKIKIKKIIRF